MQSLGVSEKSSGPFVLAESSGRGNQLANYVHSLLDFGNICVCKTHIILDLPNECNIKAL